MTPQQAVPQPRQQSRYGWVPDIPDFRDNLIGFRVVLAPPRTP